MQDVIILGFKNIKNGNDYYCQDLLSITNREGSDLEILAKRITKLCNEEGIYRVLFEHKLKGDEYPIEKAYEFINFARDGWLNKTHYVFGIFSDNELTGAIDIKSDNHDIAEIGYWASEEHKGIMTPALNEIIKYAKDNGFKKLGARVKTDNIASQKVLTRNEFIKIGMHPLEEDKVERYWFERKLI